MMDEVDSAAPVDFDELIVKTLTRGEWIQVAEAVAVAAALHLTRMGDEDGARVLLGLWERITDGRVLA